MKAAAPPSKSPKSYHHGDLKLALVQASATLIERHGVEQFTLAAAAKMANVSAAAPYRHFADKTELVAAVRHKAFEEFHVALRRAYDAGGSARDRLQQIGFAYVRFAFTHPARFRLMFDRGAEGDEKEAGSAGYTLLLETVRAVYPTASTQVVRDLATAYWSLVHGFALLHMGAAASGPAALRKAEQQLRRSLQVTLTTP